MSKLLLNRQNLLHHQAERWRPPLHSSGKGTLNQLVGHIRRFLDIQFGSIWRDLSIILPQARGVVLDVGCGAQPFRPLLAPSVNYVGVDTEDAYKCFGYRASDTLYYRGEHFPIKSGSCDLVLCTETLEHIRDPLPFIREMGRCLKPQGVLVLTVPFAARWHFIPFDYWRYTPSSLGYLLKEAGYKDTRIYARGDEFTVACYKVMGCILPLLLSKPSHLPAMFVRRLAGLVLSPIVLLCAVGANLSLAMGSEGEDCLGYTIIAEWQDGTMHSRETLIAEVVPKNWTGV